ncbi:biphenyl-2,3-diol 1,2-dioxygenase [Halorubellus sp. JP-L1]|uniref:VOC family protein n=1 Tax=Halorubellus sp. JP-L1 TaxID=2715753 RepID=UPI00140A559B|nr:VOC family protein [Halorubellus sp. JP-L1]NHN42499.1 biphenyl-2,3-diol 1,2-dioxygenase [Halorubellus sp. JP-L1]
MTDHPTLVGHVHLKVRDADRAVEFYTDVLGLEVTERHGSFAFLSFGDRHHDVALQGVGADAPGPGPGVGLYHTAFEVDAGATLAAVYERVRERDVAVSPVDHGISKAIYFDDPDGNGVEVYLDTRADRDQYEWAGVNDRFDPSAIA